MHNKQGGFSLIELLLSLTLIGALTAISFPMYSRLQRKTDLDIAVMQTAQSLRRAQTLSQAVEGDTTWGVHVQNGSMIIFKGAAYSTRDTNFDETTSMPNTVGVSDNSDFIFATLNGRPTSTGTITLSASGASKTLSINEIGTISY